MPAVSEIHIPATETTILAKIKVAVCDELKSRAIEDNPVSTIHTTGTYIKPMYYASTYMKRL